VLVKINVLCFHIKSFFSLSFFLSLSFAAGVWVASSGERRFITWLNLLSVPRFRVHNIVSNSRGARGDHSLKRAIQGPGVETVPLRSKMFGGKVI
jgi:hypothetical protein